MSQMLPFEMLWGIDTAIKKLYPEAKFEIRGNNITQWDDPNGNPAPEWNDIVEQMDKDRLAAENWLNENEGVE